MNEICETCDDDRFALIEKAKQKLLNDTNISSRADEIAVLDDILFRCWQMGWLDQLRDVEVIPERTCKSRAMSEHMEFYVQDDAASTQIGRNVYRRVSIPIDDFNAACDHYGFVKERTCKMNRVKEFPEYEDCAFECWECSACKRTNDEQRPRFCPNCGAKAVYE